MIESRQVTEGHPPASLSYLYCQTEQLAAGIAAEARMSGQNNYA